MLNRLQIYPFCFLDLCDLCSSLICSQKSTLQTGQRLNLPTMANGSQIFGKQSLSLSIPFQGLFVSPVNISNVEMFIPLIVEKQLFV